MIDLDVIKRTLNGGGGRALKKYLLIKLYELKDIENLKDIDTPANFAVEVKAQRKAYLKLKEIFQELMDMSEERKEKDPRDDYNIE